MTAIALEQKQSVVQSQRQEQVMTHQQIQALEMLAAPVLELQAMVRQEAEKNPVVEIETPEDTTQLPDENVSETGPEDEERWVEELLAIESRMDHASRRQLGTSPEEEERHQHYLDSIAAETTFHDLLREQLAFLGLPADLMECCEFVVAAVDDEGYLASHPADIAMALGTGLEPVTRAITIVQQLEPAGVGARDLRERLMLQLERRGDEGSLVYRAVADHLEDIARNRIPAVARRLGVTVEDMRGVLDELRGLKPRLDCSRATPESDYVREEIRIVEEEGELRVDVTNRYLPTLRISRQYRDMLDDPAVDDETKSYIREKIRAAAFLMNSLSQRQSTLERIVTAVLEAQQEFFREGFSRLKPLTMSQIARDIGVHETTISRGVAAKYLRCSHGMIPLRSLFTAGYEDRDGNSVSNAVVKNRIREMVEHEDPGAPLSDSRIAENLTEQGLQVARRTVAKYREAMKILPSNQRRQYWAEAR